MDKQLDTKEIHTGGIPAEKIIEEIVEAARKTMGKKLVGVYLHGSRAMGGAARKKSDIDLILVTEKPLSLKEKEGFMESVLKWEREGPKGGIELSVVEEKFCREFVYPTPYELHFSRMHLKRAQTDLLRYVKEMTGVDQDLAAHFMVIEKRGKTLYGKEIQRVFGKIPVEAYLDSVWQDIKDAKQRIEKDSVSVILNLSRTLAFLEDGFFLSKEEGGEWGMQHLMKRDEIWCKKALRCYREETELSIDEGAQEFAQRMLDKIEDKMKTWEAKTSCL